MAKYQAYDDTDDQDAEGVNFGDNWAAQTFTPETSHKLSSVRLYLRTGKGTVGDVTVSIQKVNIHGAPDGTDLVSKIVNGSGWTGTLAFITFTFASSILVEVDTEYAIVLKHLGGDINNYLNMGLDYTTSTYTRGVAWQSSDGGETWDEKAEWDYLFSESGEAADTPTVTTQAVTDIFGTIATGNGNVTDLGDAAVTQHGHCWSTSATPTTADSKTENGAKAATGVFTSAMTGLTAGTKYYVRAYATGGAGTSYGNQVVFWANKGTVYPADAITRVTSLIHRYDRGTYTLEMGLGEVIADFGLPEWESKPRVGVQEPSFQERMERTAKQLEEEAGMSREEALRIARKLETLEEMSRREQRVTKAPEPMVKPTITPEEEAQIIGDIGTRIYTKLKTMEGVTVKEAPKPAVTPEEEAQIIKDIGIRLWNKLKGQQ